MKNIQQIPIQSQNGHNAHTILKRTLHKAKKNPKKINTETPRVKKTLQKAIDDAKEEATRQQMISKKRVKEARDEIEGRDHSFEVKQRLVGRLEFTKKKLRAAEEQQKAYLRR
jgi:hypothetical protein